MENSTSTSSIKKQIYLRIIHPFAEGTISFLVTVFMFLEEKGKMIKHFISVRKK